MQSNFPIQIPNSPAGLQLQQTITSSGPVSIPSGITMVWAILIGGASTSGKLTASVAQGWVNAATTCVIGTSSGYSSYGVLYTSYESSANTMTSFGNFSGSGASGSGALYLYY
jgi:hypothetical protein